MTEMTIHEALATVKLLEKRIEKASQTPFFIEAKKNTNVIAGRPKAQFGNDAKAGYESFAQLSKNYIEIKKAIAISNATTMVEINGVTMSVIDAIEMKNFYEDQAQRYNFILSRYNNVAAKVENANTDLEDLADRFIAGMSNNFGDKADSSMISKMREEYISNRTMEIYDPANVGADLPNKIKEIEDFLNVVDFKLSESNAKTVISVEI